MMKKLIISLSLLIGMFLSLSCKHASHHSHHRYHKKKHSYNVESLAVLNAVNNSTTKGWVRFQKNNKLLGKKKVIVSAEIAGLEAHKKYGFHIHQYGNCSENAQHTGGHFNPHGTKHGSPDSKEHHIGDLGNLVANEHGVASYKKTLHICAWSIMGRSVLVHAKTDDGKSQPSGKSGPYISCGVIGRTAVTATGTLEDEEDDLLLDDSSSSVNVKKIIIQTNSKKDASGVVKPTGVKPSSVKPAVLKPSTDNKTNNVAPSPKTSDQTATAKSSPNTAKKSPAPSAPPAPTTKKAIPPSVEKTKPAPSVKAQPQVQPKQQAPSLPSAVKPSSSTTSESSSSSVVKPAEVKKPDKK